MKVNDKVTIIKPIREHCVLKAKTGQVATVIEASNDNVVIKLSNGEAVATKIDKIKPYQKKERFNIKTCTNEELMDKYDEVQKVAYYGKMGTKTWNKANIDSELIRKEILRRMNSQNV